MVCNALLITRISQIYSIREIASFLAMTGGITSFLFPDGLQLFCCELAAVMAPAGLVQQVAEFVFKRCIAFNILAYRLPLVEYDTYGVVRLF